MLYPREDKVDRVLRLACRNCDYSEIAATSKVYRHELQSSNVENTTVSHDASTDPTLPRSDKECPRCHQHEAVFYQTHSRRGDTMMTLIYVCVHCGFAFEEQ
ncbi:DNA-directed RNA polymerase II subunit RPB9 [Schizosaccharomyces pombe]